jgi:OOP family OmpA-OmpF porin
MVSMRSLGLAVAAITGLVVALPSPAQQQQRPMRTAPAWYFGAGAGVGWASWNSGDFNGVADGFNSVGLGGGGLTQTTSRESTAFGWKVFGGYRFNQYFGVEGSYADLGKFDYQYQFNQAGTQVGTGNMSYEVGSWNIAVVPRLPLENGLFLQGKVGAAFTRAENSFNMTIPGFSQSGSDSKSKTNPYLGVGLGYDFANGISVIGEYEYFGQAGSPFSYGSNGMLGTGRADMNLFSLSGMIRF